MTTITTRYKGGTLFESQLGNHSLLIDASSSKDQGPQPAALFIAALGSCIGADVADHCSRLGLDPRDMTVDIQFDRVDQPARLANLQVTIQLPRCMCAGQEQAILRLAEHGLIYETMQHGNGIQVELVDKQKSEVLKWLS